MRCLKGTFCQCLQLAVSSYIFLNSGDRIWILGHMIPLGCPLTSQILLSTSLQTFGVKWPSPAASVVSNHFPLAVFNYWRTALHAQLSHKWPIKHRHLHSSQRLIVSALPYKQRRNSFESYWSFHEMN